jgi:hypothetical protein
VNGGGEALRRPPRPLLPRRSRKRWMVVAAVAGCWAVLLYLSGSLVGGTALLLLLGVVGLCCVLSLRYAGVGPDHPWVRALATRPWRDGPDVLRVSMRHLPDVFVTTPSGALLAPNEVELRLSQRDFRSLGEVMDIALVGASATEVYVDQVAAHGARLTATGPARVRVTGDPSVPDGRYVLRQGRPGPLGAAPVFPQGAAAFGGPAAVPPGGTPVPQPSGGGFGHAHDGHAHDGHAHDGHAHDGHAHDGHTSAEAVLAPAVTGLPTVAEAHPPAIPLLTLVTGDRVAQTRASGARAGRGAVELVLPPVPTISREHARFTFDGGRWWIANLGRNGLTLNGRALAGDHPLQDGDVIRWGGKPDALVSRVEIR